MVTLVESVGQDIPMSPSQAQSLASLGRRLASQRRWRAGADGATSVIQIHPLRSSDMWHVRVVDAVGAIFVDGLQIVVEPKIVMRHLVYLLAMSSFRGARQAPTTSSLAEDQTLWDLVAEWCVSSVEELLRTGLIREYEEVTGTLRHPVGRVDPVASARSYYAGDLSFESTFDEFSIDSPLNRVLVAALVDVVRSPLLREATRRRARGALLRMEGVGPLRAGDLHVEPDRRTGRYRVPLSLARQVIGGRGLGLRSGRSTSWSFLIRTPDLVEQGLRELLDQRLPVHVKKGFLELGGTSANPDLVFGESVAIGDVKYKVGDVLDRSDLFQAVAYATAFHVPLAIVLKFRSREAPPAPVVRWGEVAVVEISWVAADGLHPELAADAVVAACSSALANIQARFRE